jgi:hypothetical protein
MALKPNKGKMIYAEKNVDIPGLDRPGSAYDLGLYRELGSDDRAVLLVTTICRLKFVDGSGPNMAWTGAEKSDFTSRLQATLIDAWSEKHVLRTVTPTALPYDVIGVVFDIQLSESLGRTTHSHWTVEITKIAPGGTQTSSTSDPWFDGILNGSVELDSEDLTPTNKGGPEMQRGAVHEFGHMMGYRDEYLKDGKAEGISGWTDDKVSVMNLGERVQPRHYIWLADWCNKRFSTLGALSKKPIEWKVDGGVNMATARIK